MKTRTVTIELAWRVETSHTFEVPYDGGVYPHDGNDDPQSLQDWLRYCEEPLVTLTAEVDDGQIDGVVDCCKFQVTDEETGEVWER